MKISLCVLGCVFIEFIGIHSNIVLHTTRADDYIYLTRYSYSPEHTKSLIFGVKECDTAIIGLMTSQTTSNNMYEIVIFKRDGIKVRKGYKKHLSMISHSESNLIDCDEFRYFTIGWHDNITVETYTVSTWRTLINMNPLPNYFVNHLAIRSHGNADWIIFDKGGSLWSRTSISDKTVKTGILWTEILKHVRKCAVECEQDVQCLSFTYNYNSKQCQGLDNNFNTEQDLKRVLEDEAGSTYYYQDLTPTPRLSN